MINRVRKRFVLVGLDEGGVRGITNPRLVCLIEDGGKLAIWGTLGNRTNIDLVLSQGMPCEVECAARAPSEWAQIQYGHTWWVPEDAPLCVIRHPC